jgi:hypothetical protein
MDPAPPNAWLSVGRGRAPVEDENGPVGQFGCLRPSREHRYPPTMVVEALIIVALVAILFWLPRKFRRRS